MQIPWVGCGYLLAAHIRTVLCALLKRLACDQANASPLVANGIIEHIVGFVLRIPN